MVYKRALTVVFLSNNLYNVFLAIYPRLTLIKAPVISELDLVSCPAL